MIKIASRGPALEAVRKYMTLFLKAEKIPAIIFRAYILTEAQLRSISPPNSPKTNVDTETAFRHDHCKTRVHIQK